MRRPGDAHQLTHLPQGVHEFDWGQTDSQLVVSARDIESSPDDPSSDRSDVIVTEQLHYKSDGSGWMDGRTSKLFIVSTDSHETRSIDGTNGGGISETTVGLQPAVRPGRPEVAFVSNRAERPQTSLSLDVSVVNLDQQTVRMVTSDESKSAQLRWSPDGRFLAYNVEPLADPYEPDSLAVFDTELGTVHTPLESLDRSVVFEQPPQWIGSKQLITRYYDGGDTRLADVRFNHGEFAVDSLSFEKYDEWTIGEVSVTDTLGAFVLTSPTSGTDLFVSREPEWGSRLDVERQTTANSELLDTHGDQFPSVYRTTTAVDDMVVESVVYAPPEFDPKAPTPHRTIVSIPGGPLSCELPRYHFDWLFWTSRGYLVVRPNYRGSVSYGRAFAECIRGDWGTKESEDVVSVVEDLISLGWADPESVLLQGFSYGALVGSFALARSDAFAAAALEHGNYDYRSCYGTSDYHGFLETTLGLPWENPEAYERSSLGSAVADINTPTILIAGGEDFRSPMSQSEQLYTALRRRGVPARLLVYARDAHGVSTDRREHRLTKLEQWYERFLPATRE
jgi:dipeptidyl aminopeptidase/acylaminoacyl peptidase